MSEGRNCSSCFWASERQSDRTEGTEHVQSGCYINMFTGLAQCGTPLRPSTWPHCGNEERFFLWSNDGDIQRSNKEQILVTHRAVMETHSVQQDTWTIYSVSILIWLFIKLLFSLSFSNSGAGWIPNLRYPEKIWWISWSFFPQTYIEDSILTRYIKTKNLVEVFQGFQPHLKLFISTRRLFSSDLEPDWGPYRLYDGWLQKLNHLSININFTQTHKHFE